MPPREWYNAVYEEFIKLGAVRSKLDNAMFMWYEGDEIIGHLCTHVDDFNFAGTKEWEEQVMGAIRSKFKISTENERAYMYLGLNINQSDEGISMDQKHYINKLQEVAVKRGRLNTDLLTQDEKSTLRSLSGQMLWVTNQTRPDVAFDTCMMSNVGKNPIVKQLKEANKAIRKLKNSNSIKINIPNLGELDKLRVIVHGDASHAALPDGSSQGALIVFVSGNRHMVPVLWKSKKLRRVTKSPLASEILAVGEASDAGVLLSKTIMEAYKLSKPPAVICYTDSKSLIENLKSSNTVEDMSVRVEIARLREMVNLGRVNLPMGLKPAQSRRCTDQNNRIF